MKNRKVISLGNNNGILQMIVDLLDNFKLRNALKFHAKKEHSFKDKTYKS